jgi:hypothetical protein
LRRIAGGPPRTAATASGWRLVFVLVRSLHHHVLQNRRYLSTFLWAKQGEVIPLDVIDAAAYYEYWLEQFHEMEVLFLHEILVDVIMKRIAMDVSTL